MSTNLWAMVIADVEAMERKEFDCEEIDEPIAVQVLADMRARDRFGFEKYKTPLTVDADLDFLREAYEEQLDKVVYLKGWLEKHEAWGASFMMSEFDAHTEAYKLAAARRLAHREVSNMYTGAIRELWQMGFTRSRLS